jgi:ribosomal protein S18 acetylase RimI-like enzyme
MPMHADWTVRALRSRDLPAYKALRDELLALHPEAFTSDAATEAARPAASYAGRIGLESGHGGHFTLGAWIAERLCGAVSCEHDPRVKVRHIGHLTGMMVHPDARGRGLGRTLLAECIGRARRDPALEMLTLTVTSGNAAAVALYRAAGFVRYGQLPHAIRLGNTYHDKDLMVLNLR